MLVLPDELRPADGRFGSGPSKVRQDAVDLLALAAPGLLGTSHRREGVKSLVRRIRTGMRDFFDLPDDYEVVLGNGGATLFWDMAVHGLIRDRSAHAVFGEFSSKFAAAVAAAPWLGEPVVVEADAGTHPPIAALRDAGAGVVDCYAFTHCETSTGVAMPIARPSPEALVLVDATSAAGGLVVDPSAFDAYYFSPQKCFGSEGGLWIALLSPAALARVDELSASRRYIPATLDLVTALDNARKEQTYNTPAIATLFLLAEQMDWLIGAGGLAWAASDCAAKAGHLYAWADASDYAAPFVTDPAQRSSVVCTIDLEPHVDAGTLSRTLRDNGVVDTEAYRKLGRNQLRIAVFPAVDRPDVERLTAAIDWLVARLSP